MKSPLASAGSRVAILVVAAVLLAGSATLHDETTAPAFSQPSSVEWPRPAVAPPIPARLTDPGLDLRAPPVAVPIELLLPTLSARMSVIGVGMLANNV